MQQGIVGYQQPDPGLDIAPPSYGGGVVAPAALYASATSATEPAILPSVTNSPLGSFGASTTEAGNGAYLAQAEHGPIGYLNLINIGLHEAPADGGGAAAVATSSGPATSLPAPGDLASPAKPAPGSFGASATDGAANTDAGVGSGGATAAQVQQALDESGLSVNGSGIKVGVLSDSFNDLGGAAADEADGALPSAADIDVIKDLASGGTDEGRAMMQIIHDIAPGASLAFYTAFDSEQDFANGILALAAAGCKVIVDDVELFRRAVLSERRGRAGDSNRGGGRRHLRHGGRQRRQQRLSGRLDADIGYVRRNDAHRRGELRRQPRADRHDQHRRNRRRRSLAAGVEPGLRRTPPRISRFSSSTAAEASSARRPTHRAASRPIRGSEYDFTKTGTYSGCHRKPVRAQSRPDQGDHRGRRPAGHDQRCEYRHRLSATP